MSRFVLDRPRGVNSILAISRFGLIALVLCVGSTGCRTLGLTDSPIVGSWQSHDQSFRFREDGTGSWTIDELGTFSFRYRFDDSEVPATLDLTGFDRGPLVGSALFGIARITDDDHGTVLTYDCSAAPEGTPAARARPRLFSTQETRSYRRVDESR